MEADEARDRKEEQNAGADQEHSANTRAQIFEYILVYDSCANIVYSHIVLVHYTHRCAMLVL